MIIALRVLQRSQSSLSKNAYESLVIFTGVVLGATQIPKKIKTELKENPSRSISEAPWPPFPRKFK
jgi:hypothetical protein